MLYAANSCWYPGIPDRIVHFPSHCRTHHHLHYCRRSFVNRRDDPEVAHTSGHNPGRHRSAHTGHCHCSRGCRSDGRLLCRYTFLRGYSFRYHTVDSDMHMALHMAVGRTCMRKAVPAAAPLSPPSALRSHNHNPCCNPIHRGLENTAPLIECSFPVTAILCRL